VQGALPLVMCCFCFVYTGVDGLKIKVNTDNMDAAQSPMSSASSSQAKM